MKYLVIALSLFTVSAQAARVEGPKFVKMLDGGIAYCNERALGSAAYYPTALELNALDRETLRFSAPISFVTCASGEGNFGWAPRNPLEPVPARDLDGRNILNVTKGNEFVLLSNSTRLIGLQEIKNEPSQTAAFTIPLGRVLSPSERESLDRGTSVSSRFTFFTRAIVSVITAEGKEVQIGMRAGGAYTVLFTVVKVRDTLQVTSLSLQ